MQYLVNVSCFLLALGEVQLSHAIETAPKYVPRTSASFTGSSAGLAAEPLAMFGLLVPVPVRDDPARTSRPKMATGLCQPSAYPQTS